MPKLGPGLQVHLPISSMDGPKGQANKLLRLAGLLERSGFKKSPTFANVITPWLLRTDQRVKPRLPRGVSHRSCWSIPFSKIRWTRLRLADRAEGQDSVGCKPVLHCSNADAGDASDLHEQGAEGVEKRGVGAFVSGGLRYQCQDLIRQ